MGKQVVCILASIAFLPLGRAGVCNWSLQDKTLDLDVVFEYKETNTERWKEMFTRASALLYNATEGQLRLGKVRMYHQCVPRFASADVTISTGDDVARAHVDRCGWRGFHIFLWEARHWKNDADNRGHLGLVHEIGHYFFGLHDEYKGFSAANPLSFSLPLLFGPPVATDHGVYCQNPVGGTGCLMDAGTGTKPDFGKTEFCTASPVHVGMRPGGGTKETGDAKYFYITKQELVNGSHCWRKIAQKLNYFTAQGPAAVSVVMPPGFQNPTFPQVSLQKRFSIVIDTTGSMARNNRLGAAKIAAKSFVYSADLPLLPGDPSTVDFLGVVHFRDKGAEVTTMDSALDEEIVLRDIDELAVSTAVTPKETSIGAGLAAGLAQFSRQGLPGCIEAIILITDGEQNVDPAPVDVLPDLVRRGVVVYPVFIGEGVVPQQLRDIARATAGRVFSAANADGLGAILSDIQSATLGQATVDLQAGTLARPNSQTVTVNLPTPAGGYLAGFTRFNIGGAGFSVRLIAPDGTTYDSTTTGSVEYHTMGTVQTFSVKDASGNWRVEVTRTGAGTGQFEVTTVAPTSGTRLETIIPAFDFATDRLAEKIVQAVVNQGGAVTGGSIVADVKAPDGSVSAVSLVDNGDASMGDRIANDGIYSANMSALSMDGNYLIAWRANTTGGELVAGEKSEVATPTPAQPAIRVARTNTFVRVTPPGGAAAQVVNQHLRQVAAKGVTEGTHCIAGESTFLVTATWQNISSFTIADPFARLYVLTNGNRFIGQQFLLGESGMLAPGQTMTGLLRLKLASCAAFQFKVDITGTVSTVQAGSRAVRQPGERNSQAENWQYDFAPDTAPTSRR